MSTWIFLRGWAREARHWGDFPAQFSAVMPDAEIVELDPPGGGRFYAQRSLLTVESMVERAREWLRARSTPAPYHLLGLSLGGMVSLDWASRHPEEIAACVVLNTSLRPLDRGCGPIWGFTATPDGRHMLSVSHSSTERFQYDPGSDSQFRPGLPDSRSALHPVFGRGPLWESLFGCGTTRLE